MQFSPIAVISLSIPAIKKLHPPTAKVMTEGIKQYAQVIFCQKTGLVYPEVQMIKEGMMNGNKYLVQKYIEPNIKRICSLLKRAKIH